MKKGLLMGFYPDDTFMFVRGTHTELSEEARKKWRKFTIMRGVVGICTDDSDDPIGCEIVNGMILLKDVETYIGPITKVDGNVAAVLLLGFVGGATHDERLVLAKLARRFREE